MKPSSRETMRECDVVVVGAGSTGSAAAWMLAQTGLNVICIDERDPDKTGASWNNEIPPWMFERAGIAQIAPEDNPLTGPITFIDRNSAVRIAIEQPLLCVVDMRKLVAQLHDAARTSGVNILYRTRAVGIEIDGERPVALSAETSIEGGKKRRIKLRAKLFVDASGFAGVVRERVPALAQKCPEIASSETGAAARELCVVKDNDAAQRFLDRYDLQPGGTALFAGIDGGYSWLGISIHSDLQRVELECKTIADGRHASGADWLLRLKKQEPWIGKRLFGGQGLIPLRKPYPHAVAPGAALIGDAACQVFSLNGSGAGLGFVAARLLADAVMTADDPGAFETLQTYQSAFDKECGLMVSLADIARQALQSLVEDEIELLIGSGLLQPAILRSIWLQTVPRPSDLDFAALARAAKGIPGLALRLLPFIAKAGFEVAKYGVLKNW